MEVQTTPLIPNLFSTGVLPTGKTILVLTDSNFRNKCLGHEDYVDRLKDVLVKQHGENVSILTPEGRYGLGHTNDVIKSVEVDDRSKTTFVQSLENINNLFDECVLISLFVNDNYLIGAREIITENNKSITHFRYQSK